MSNTLWRLLALAATHRRWMALAVLLGFATVASGVGLLANAAYLIASAALQPSVAHLAVAIVGVRFFGIARGVFRYLERYVSHRVTFSLLARLRTWFYAAVEPLAPAGLQGERSGDLLARVVSDVETLQQFFLRVLAPAAVAVLVVVATWAFVGAFDPGVALGLVAVLLVGGVLLPLLARRLGAAAGRQMVAVRGRLGAQLVDGIQGLADLTAFGQEQAQARRVAALTGELAAAESRLARLAGVQGSLSTLTANLGLWVVLVLAIPLVSEGRLSGVYLPVLALAALAAFEAVQPLPLAFQYLEQSLASAGRLFGIVAGRAVPKPIDRGEPVISAATKQTRLSAQGQALPLPLGEGGGEGTVSLESRISAYRAVRADPHPSPPFGPGARRDQGLPKGEGTVLANGGVKACSSLPEGEGETRLPALAVADLRFRYGPDEPWALDGVSFAVSPGAQVAIVGPSGAGKSSVVNLLLRFWDYHEGSITLHGREIRDLPPDEVRRQIALVAQRTYLFNGTIRDNLLLARPEASEEQLVEGAERARLHAFVCALPRGYDTWIGEQGLRLSGGERQRLAIARALLKDAPLLVLDEATANLDSLTEQEVWRALTDLRRGRTTLTITHRLAGLEGADEILVLDRGRVGERGRHDDLLAAGGLYRRMWDVRRQALPEV